MNRATLYKLLPIAKRELQMHEDDYRSLLYRHGATPDNLGRISAKSMHLWQLENALGEMKKKGFRIKSGSRMRKPNGELVHWREPRINKIKNLWSLLAQSSHPESVRDGSDAALRSFLKRHVHKFTELPWANTFQLNDAIEQLKKWCNRCNVRY